MRKKILDVAVVWTAICFLCAGSNIKEEKTQAAWAKVKSTDTGYFAVREITAESNGTAGVNCILVPDSFTTESGERAEIKQNGARKVGTASEETNADKTEETIGETVESDAVKSKNRWGITLTEEEIDLLARIVWLESCGESVEGQEAVVEVVLNRMASDIYPDTLYEVLSQENPVQFCSWAGRNTAEPTEKEYGSIYEVLNGNTNILRSDTLYFSTKPLTSGIDVTIGGHSFCY
jgi:N-acetylmuramoyl-L-alanine amidase